MRWYKDWYFPEGGTEGEMKLQGDKPLDEEHKQRNTREIIRELQEYLRREGQEPYTEYARKIIREVKLGGDVNIL